MGENYSILFIRVLRPKKKDKKGTIAAATKIETQGTKTQMVQTNFKTNNNAIEELHEAFRSAAEHREELRRIRQSAPEEPAVTSTIPLELLVATRQAKPENLGKTANDAIFDVFSFGSVAR